MVWVSKFPGEGKDHNTRVVGESWGMPWVPEGVLGCRLGVLHLVLFPELMELITVNGKLDKMQVVALDAEVQVPEPENKAGWGRE